MQIEYGDEELRHLAEDSNARAPDWGEDLLRSYRKKVQILAAALDERDLAAQRGLRFEKLKGDRRGTFSIRLNDQYRLILRFRTESSGRVVTIIEVVDYH